MLEVVCFFVFFEGSAHEANHWALCVHLPSARRDPPGGEPLGELPLVLFSLSLLWMLLQNVRTCRRLLHLRGRGICLTVDNRALPFRGMEK